MYKHNTGTIATSKSSALSYGHKFTQISAQSLLNLHPTICVSRHRTNSCHSEQHMLHTSNCTKKRCRLLETAKPSLLSVSVPILSRNNACSNITGVLSAQCTHKRWCYHGPGQRCAQSQPIPLSSGLAVIPDEGRLCVQPTVVVEAPRKKCETSDVQVDLGQLSSVVGNASATLSGTSAPQNCQSGPYTGPHGPNRHQTATCPV